jgi:hypothetical protein
VELEFFIEAAVAFVDSTRRSRSRLGTHQNGPPTQSDQIERNVQCLH